MIDISKAFGTSSETVSAFFQRPGVGYYIPYINENTVGTKKTHQSIEDICRGVLLIEDKTIRFLGQLFLSQNAILININPRDNRALPPRIDNVIDGQQRISTIALLACLPTTVSNKEKVPNSSDYGGIEETVNSYLETLLEVFSFDLKRGSPIESQLLFERLMAGHLMEMTKLQL